MHHWAALAIVGTLFSSGSATAAPAVPPSSGLSSPSPLMVPVIIHRRKTISAYCTPRNYWWFYRPYTTAAEGYPRCMPYFHYPAQQPYGQGGKAYPRTVK